MVKPYNPRSDAMIPRRDSFKSALVSLLICTLSCSSLLKVSQVNAASCKDPLTEVPYADCPPQEILDRGIGTNQKSAIITKWQDLDLDSKKAIREYLTGQRELEERQLFEEKELCELNHKVAEKELRNLLIKAMGRMGMSTTVVAVDAAANLYLAGKLLARQTGIGGQERPKRPASQLTAEEAKQAERLAQNAAKRLKYTQSAERALAEAEANLARRRQARLSNQAGHTKEPWLIRPGEGHLPSTARKASAGRPMVLDHNEATTYLYIVKEDGTIVYAPQRIVNGRETVKHPDLGWGNKARIGGEIKYENGTWIMDNNSGRYSANRVQEDKYMGQFLGIREQQNLEAAANLARNSGTTARIETRWRNYQQLPPYQP